MKNKNNTIKLRMGVDILEVPSYKVSHKNEVVETKSLILYNDNVNTFDHVMSCLVDFCGHTEIQAEQCAMLVHYNGKYAVKGGSYSDLKPIAEALLENHLTVTIE